MGSTARTPRCFIAAGATCSAPNAEIPVLAEELSGLGAPALAALAGPGLAAGTVAWFEQGSLIGYEHVGGASVSWDPEDGLGRGQDPLAVRPRVFAHRRAIG